MKIAIVGAGGVGGYYGGCLARAGHDVAFLARGDHLAAIRAQGLEIREPEGSSRVAVAASDDVDDLAGAELAVVAVKSYSLPEIAPAVSKLAERGAVVLPLLNGVEAVESLAGRGVDLARILAGLTMISAARVAPGVVERKSAFRTAVVGEPGGGGSARAEAVAAVFREAGVETRVSEDVAVDLWKKFLFIATVSAACGLARAAVGAVRGAPYGRLLFERAAAEVGAVGRSRGVALPAGEEERVLGTIDGLAPALKPSFLLDLERGGKNELDILSGAVARYGRQAGVATPIHDAVVAALSAAA
jgi:2-dehydropantoate 2-reductase